MTNKIKRFFPALQAILKHEGFKSLLSRGCEYIRHRTFLIEDYYVEIGGLVEPFEPEDHLPKAENYHACIISTNKEADELLSKGFNFGAYELNLRATLDKEVSTCCIFIDKEFAHMLSKTDNHRGKNVVDSRPFHVKFGNGSIVGGKAFTVPKFRRLGLRKHSHYLMRKDDQEKGYKEAYATIKTDNIPALMNAAQNPNNRIVSKCRCITILCLKYYKETKLDPIVVKEMIEQRAKSNLSSN
jgi:hypothetical protein